MKIFDLQQLPVNVPRNRLAEQVKLLAQFNVFSGKERIVLTYLGGITNHGLKEHTQNVFIRIPGVNSNYFVDRTQELDTLYQLADFRLYPGVIEAYAVGELKGYKVESFIEGATLQFSDFVKHRFKVLPALKELHDSNVHFSRVYDIFEQLLLMCERLIVQGEASLPFLIHGNLERMSIAEVKNHINTLRSRKETLFRHPDSLSPCHNDITPTNFIKLKYPVNGRKYQLIDWEYAGMNDKMYDIAGVAAMLGMNLDESYGLVLRYFNSTNLEKYTEEIKRVKFYMPLVKLYYAVWSALQVSTGNESASIEELRSGWGPGSLSVFLRQYHSQSYQALISGCLQ
ncbi:MAG: phosphotransferase [Gammaproteobacteria bacterium]|nr:phosphotransferase [Gammaproteobacteria bacterium]